jgi:hypothetical protein
LIMCYKRAGTDAAREFRRQAQETDASPEMDPEPGRVIQVQLWRPP